MGEEFEQPYFAELAEFVRSEYRGGVIYPPAANIFRAFDKCDPEAVRSEERRVGKECGS